MKKKKQQKTYLPKHWTEGQSAMVTYLSPQTTELHILGDLTSEPVTFLDHWTQESVWLFHLLEGTATVKLNEEPEFTLDAATSLVLLPGRFLTLRLTGKTNRLLYMSLRGKGIVDAIFRLGLWDRQQVKVSFASDLVGTLYKFFSANRDNGRDPDVLRLCERLLQSLSARVRVCCGNTQLFDAVRTIHTMPRERFTTEAAAALLGVTRATLTNLFRAEGFPPPGEYIAHVREMLAKELIYNNELSNEQIAQRLGFSGASPFSAFFHRRTGLTPREFRKRPLPLPTD